jgi:hypothetical protein
VLHSLNMFYLHHNEDQIVGNFQVLTTPRVVIALSPAQAYTPYPLGGDRGPTAPLPRPLGDCLP